MSLSKGSEDVHWGALLKVFLKCLLQSFLYCSLLTVYCWPVLSVHIGPSGSLIRCLKLNLCCMSTSKKGPSQKGYELKIRCTKVGYVQKVSLILSHFLYSHYTMQSVFIWKIWIKNTKVLLIPSLSIFFRPNLFIATTVVDQKSFNVKCLWDLLIFKAWVVIAYL